MSAGRRYVVPIRCEEEGCPNEGTRVNAVTFEALSDAWRLVEQYQSAHDEGTDTCPACGVLGVAGEPEEERPEDVPPLRWWASGLVVREAETEPQSPTACERARVVAVVPCRTWDDDGAAFEDIAGPKPEGFAEGYALAREIAAGRDALGVLRALVGPSDGKPDECPRIMARAREVLARAAGRPEDIDPPEVDDTPPDDVGPHAGAVVREEP